MKTWDPLSIFKYLTGSPTIHLTMFILLLFTHKEFEENGKNRSLYEYNEGPLLFREKVSVIYTQMYVHLACFLIHMLFDAGILNLVLCMKKSMFITPGLSLFT